MRIAAIHAQCRGFYSAELIEAWTSGGPTTEFTQRVEATFYVAIDGGKVLGCGAIDLDFGQIDAIFILPDFMGRGVGRQLLTSLEDVAIAAGLNQAILNSTLNAAAFYRKCGYKGNTVSVYSSSRGFELDCVPMKKILRRPVDAQTCP